MIFEVYDRIGQLIFQVEDTPLVEIENWWDGRFRGDELEAGVYTYHYQITYPEFPPDFVAGTVVLMK